MNNTVRIRPTVGSASGKRRGWCKHITSVDETTTNGYAFGGDFLAAGRETDLPLGAVILHVDPEGSVKNGWQSAHVTRLEADGSETELTEGTLDWRDDFLTIRDAVAAALDGGATDNPLEYYSDEQILTEARLRGLV